ncbi:MAG: phytanoyl-CoA dioxygenase family protein [Acidimicrobiia bacterium]|nr:phytanoyl-CoA dioxygenase family protein [Acidimicrobiia bacterium]
MIDEHLDRLEEHGYTVLSDVIDERLLDELARDLSRLELELDATPAANSFEGTSTTRIYNLLAHGHPWTQVPTHPAVLPIVQAVLDDGCLVSSLSSIAIGPGETAQPIHADDQVMPIPKPHPAAVCNSMWALTDFTDANGATRIVPGSHRLDHDPTYGQTYDTEPVEMARGSVLVWVGSLWHGGGANTTDGTRLGIAMNYCAGYIRPQENQQLGIPAEVMATFTPQLRDLCGLGVYRGLIGHIDKQTPAARLYGDDPSVNLWDLDPA